MASAFIYQFLFIFLLPRSENGRGEWMGAAKGFDAALHGKFPSYCPRKRRTFLTGCMNERFGEMEVVKGFFLPLNSGICFGYIAT